MRRVGARNRIVSQRRQFRKFLESLLGARNSVICSLSTLSWKQPFVAPRAKAHRGGGELTFVAVGTNDQKGAGCRLAGFRMSAGKAYIDLHRLRRRSRPFADFGALRNEGQLRTQRGLTQLALQCFRTSKFFATSGCQVLSGRATSGATPMSKPRSLCSTRRAWNRTKVKL